MKFLRLIDAKIQWPLHANYQQLISHNILVWNFPQFFFWKFHRWYIIQTSNCCQCCVLLWWAYVCDITTPPYASTQDEHLGIFCLASINATQRKCFLCNLFLICLHAMVHTSNGILIWHWKFQKMTCNINIWGFSSFREHFSHIYDSTKTS